MRLLRAYRKSRLVAGSRRGSVIAWFAITTIPLIIAVGVGIDIARAYTVKVRLMAALDDAGLAVASTMDPTIDLNARLINYYYGNFAANGIGTATSVTMVNDPNKANTIDVSGTATVPTLFMQIAGFGNITVGGSAQVTKRSPNIDFYLLLDSSPSMAIAATQAGINTMVANTSAQGGCAFGCHQTNPAADNLGNPGGIDNYQLARNLGVTLRIDLLRQATQNLMTTAQNTEATYNAMYRVGIYTFDVNFNTIQTLTSNLTTAQSSAGNIQMLTVYKNNWLTSSNNNSDADTNYDTGMNNINNTMPAPGNGTNIAGDTPQEVLFFVTDGVEDENVSGTRTMSVMNPSWCTTVKNRGIRIAVLYTVYLPLPTNSFYNAHISSWQPNIGTTLQTCASPGLYFQVTTDGDISAAMAKLFQQAVQTAYLAQ
ncbi:MAG TPA: pilus assembly protein TadG-related protein [Stellaceae bacterium]|nr:pilus assembly protein TadG-related protein [Stellaceae bacterium]